MTRTLLRAGALLATLVPVLALAAEPEVTPAPDATADVAPPAGYDKDKAHGYVGFGLVAASSEQSALFVSDVEASGGGIVGRGVGHSGKVNPSLDIAFSGQLALMSRTYDDTDEEVGDFLVEVDGGMRLSDLFYVSLGYLTQATAFENPDVTLSYNVVPISAGILKTSASGYWLLQLRLGAGNLSNDQNNDTERVDYGGLRAVMQQSFGSGIQFMLGLGFDRFDLGDYQTEDFVRLDFGLGFGI